MTDLADGLAAILKTIRRPGDFSALGAFDLLPPGIEVEGVGPLALPVLPEQAAKLIDAAERAPYGRGQETIVDTSVRRSWQIEPRRVRFTGKRWPETLAAVVSRAAAGLGVEDRVSAEFYKLLVYEEGGFFVSHRDTEKSSGMFATLVIALPSISTGGELVVRHAGREVRAAMRSDDPAEARFAAFYADCVHEVLPVESGRRVTLVYSLTRSGKGAKPVPPSHEREERQLAALLGAWSGEAAFVPAKLVYPLEHAYTPAEIAFASLKGADAAAAGVLANAAAKAGCDLRLALLTIEQSGGAEYIGGGRSGRGRRGEDDPDDYDFVEVAYETHSLGHWRAPDGTALALGEMPVTREEYSPPDAVETMKPDENHFREATGNEGATIERTYRRAALALWPRAGFLPMIAAAGLDVSLPYLGDLTGRWQAGGDEVERARLAGEGRAIAASMIERWPTRQYPEREDQPTSATTFLRNLAALGAGDLIARFLASEAAASGRVKSDNPAAIEALSCLAPSDRVEAIGRTIGVSAASAFAACANLLALAARAWSDLDAPELKTAAARLMVHRPPHGAPDRWGRAARVDSETVANIFRALVPIDPELADRSLDAILSDSHTYDRDAALIPALRVLMADDALASAPVVARLREACVAHLKARIAIPLAPPTDFGRDAELTCHCALCAPLARFLADPAAKTWSMRAVQSERSHVESTILNAKPDVVTETVRKGSPHTLVVTKTQASYERLAKQRREDVAMLARIEAETG